MLAAVDTWTIHNADLIDESDVLIGYMDGFSGAPAPGSDHSWSYRHGWRNGRLDVGCSLPDEDRASAELVFETEPAIAAH